MPRNAFIPFGNRYAQANNQALLPTNLPINPEGLDIDPPQLIQQPYIPNPLQGSTPVPYGPSVDVPTNRTAGNVSASWQPTAGTRGFGATGGTYDYNGYTDPSGVYWPNTTITESPSGTSKFLSGLGKLGINFAGSMAGGLLGPVGGILGGVAGKKIGDKFLTPKDRVTFSPGGPSASYINPNQVPGGTYDETGGYQEPGENGRYWPKTTTETINPNPQPGNLGPRYVHNINDTTGRGNGVNSGWGRTYGMALDMINAPGQANRAQVDQLGYTGDDIERASYSPNQHSLTRADVAAMRANYVPWSDPNWRSKLGLGSAGPANPLSAPSQPVSTQTQRFLDALAAYQRARGG